MGPAGGRPASPPSPARGRNPRRPGCRASRRGNRAPGALLTTRWTRCWIPPVAGGKSGVSTRVRIIAEDPFPCSGRARARRPAGARGRGCGPPTRSGVRRAARAAAAPSIHPSEYSEPPLTCSSMIGPSGPASHAPIGGRKAALRRFGASGSSSERSCRSRFLPPPARWTDGATRGGELGELAIQVGGAHLQRGQHPRPVGLDEDVVGQPVKLVEAHQRAGHRVGARLVEFGPQAGQQAAFGHGRPQPGPVERRAARAGGRRSPSRGGVRRALRGTARSIARRSRGVPGPTPRTLPPSAAPRRPSPRQPRLDALEPRVAWVATEQLVGALAAERHGHLVAGELGDRVQGHHRGVGKGHVEPGEKARDPRCRFVGVEDDFSVLAADQLGHLAGDAALVVGLVAGLVADREGLQRLVETAGPRSAATTVESRPPLRKTPSGTSERSLPWTERSSRWRASAVSSAGILVSPGHGFRRAPIAASRSDLPSRAPRPSGGPGGSCSTPCRIDPSAPGT